MRSARQPSHSPHRGVRSNDVRDHTLSCNLLVAVIRLTLLDLPGERRGDQQPRAGRDRGDDHALSEHWAISLAGEYPEYRQTARMELTTANRSESYAGIATTFSASIAGSQVVGRSFARVWSADSAALPVTHGVPAEELRYDVLGRGCSWHDDRGPIGAVPLAGKITGACNTNRPHLRLSLHLLHEGAPCTTSVPGRPPVTALATAPGPQGDSS